MKRLLLLGTALIFGAAIFIMAGCSDDDPASTEKVTGDPNDPAFEVIGDIAGQGNFMMDMNLINISLGLYENMYGDADKSALKQSAEMVQDFAINYLVYDTSNYWHIFECSVLVYDIEEDYDGYEWTYDTTFFSYAGIDSLRFSNNDGYMYIMDSSTNAANIRAHFHVDFEGGDQYGEFGNHGRFDLTEETEYSYTVSGTSNDSITMSGYTETQAFCELHMYFDQTITELLIDEIVEADEGCPLSGSVDLAFNVGLECTGDNPSDSLVVGGNWWADFEFDNGYLHAVYEDETTRWTINEPCREMITRRGWTSAFR